MGKIDAWFAGNSAVAVRHGFTTTWLVSKAGSPGFTLLDPDMERFGVTDFLRMSGERPDGTIVIASLNDTPDADEAAMLMRLDDDARDQRRPAIVEFPRDAIDDVSARISSPHVTLLCEPTNADRIAALSTARLARAQTTVGTPLTTEAVSLQALADEVARIAQALAGLADDGDGSTPRHAVSDGLIGFRAGPAIVRPLAPPAVVRAEDIRTILRLRRRREALFGEGLFADPAWDMILDLMAARIERLRVAVSSLCIAAAVPPTTALRWIKTLTDIGIFVRVADPTDGRRVFIELSDKAADAVLTYLGEVKSAGSATV